ncbi:MAG: hypothetical protein COW45_05065 [Gallionellales bacterium CG17_big_fil_post_rev_8_21_14_2_50_54_146]|nr:MAG: hypothetical protein COW45_05065 [Gallionellales bacterium CG17_big_fil_post_rev_8_21_14_2_50_54_146]
MAHRRQGIADLFTKIKLLPLQGGERSEGATGRGQLEGGRGIAINRLHFHPILTLPLKVRE